MVKLTYHNKLLPSLQPANKRYFLQMYDSPVKGFFSIRYIFWKSVITNLTKSLITGLTHSNLTNVKLDLVIEQGSEVCAVEVKMYSQFACIHRLIAPIHNNGYKHDLYGLFGSGRWQVWFAYLCFNYIWLFNLTFGFSGHSCYFIFISSVS